MMKIGHSWWLILPLFYILPISIDLSSASNHELKEELRHIHQEIGFLRDENHHQNIEIALLKERIGNTKDSEDERMVETYLAKNRRYKRPVRLLPPHILYGERKNETELQKQINRRRYQQPTSCADLSLLGYTLNGFYLVKSNESSTNSSNNSNSISTNNETQLETVFCAFKQPEGTFYPDLVEKRIISRRETKPSSSIVLCFYATRNTDFEPKSGKMVTITFDKININLWNAFDVAMGTFHVPKSGVYLFTFSGVITFPVADSSQFWLYYTYNGTIIGKDASYNPNQSTNVEFDKVINAKRGDIITVGTYFYTSVAKFLGNSTFFNIYLLRE